MYGTLRGRSINYYYYYKLLLLRTANKGPHNLSEFTKRLACNIYTGHVRSELDR